MSTPFKFLDAYEPKDKAIFFGRDEEVEQLYKLVFQSNLLLVYGQSGTGKTSLVQCGLAGRFKRVDWFEIFVRRQDDLNKSLDREIRRHATTPIDAAVRVAPALQSLYLDHLRPVYLIFDQFEELFVLGSREEQATFIATAATLLKSAVSCKIIIVMREEYLAMLDDFEKAVPTLFNKRFRVEPMTRRNVEMVISRTTAALGIGLEREGETARQIVDNLSEQRSTVQLSYLQVYLDKLYRSAAAGGAGAGAGGDSGDGAGGGGSAAAPPVVFTTELVRRTGALRDVLLEFLEEQTALIQADLKSRFRPAPDDLVRRVLEEFTTLEGTKNPRTRAQIDAIFAGHEDMLDFCLSALESRRLLRKADGVLELAHDSLAARIAEQRSGEAKNLLNIRKVITDRSAAYAQTHAYLARQELDLIALYRPKLTLNDAEVQFLDASTRAVAAQRRWVRAGFAAIVLLLAAVGTTFFLLWRNTRAMVEANNSASLRKTVLESRAMFDSAVPATLDLALQLSATAFRLRQDDDSYDALHTAMQRAARVEKIWHLAAPVLAIAGDQNAVVTVTPTGMARFQSLRGGGAAAQVLSGQDGAVRAAAFSPDDRRLATAGDAGMVEVWNVADEPQLRNSLHADGGPAWSLAFSPDGELLAAGYEDGHVELWDLASGKSAASLTGHALRVSGVAFSPDGRMLATASDDHHVMLWDVSERRPLARATMQHGGAVSAVAFSPDGLNLVSGGADHCARLWRVDTGQPVGAPLCAHAARIFSVAFSPDGRTLATGSLDGTARLWEAASGKAIEPALSGHKGLVWSVKFTRDGASLISTSSDATVIRWSVADPAAPLEISPSPLRALTLSPDGKILAAGGDDHRVQRWTLAAGAARATVFEPSLAKQADSIAALGIDRTGEELAVSSEDDTFQVVALRTGRPLSERRRSPGGNVFALAFDPAGTTLATGSYDGSVVLWDPRGGDALATLMPAHQGSVLALAYSADGRSVASASVDRTVRVWSADGAHSVQARLEGHQDTVWDVAFHPSGRMLASASDDKSVRFWDLPGGAPHATALLHEAGVRALAFSPNGRVLASGDAQGSIYWWDVPSARRVFIEHGAHQDAVTNLAYLPDGETLLSAGEDGALRRWDSPDSWIDRICSKLNSNMSRTQWRQWVGELDYVAQCPGLPIQPDEGGS